MLVRMEITSHLKEHSQDGDLPDYLYNLRCNGYKIVEELDGRVFAERVV